MKDNRQNKEKEYKNIENNPILQETLKLNEKKANRLCSGIFIVVIVVMVIDIVLTLTGVFTLTGTTKFLLVVIGCMLVSIICNKSGRISSSVIKWMNISIMILVATLQDAIFNYNATLVIVLPIMLSSMYFNRKTVIVASSITALVFGIETYLASAAGLLIDNNHVVLGDGAVLVVKDTLKNAIKDYGMDMGAYARHMMVLGYVPKLIMLIIIVAIAMVVAKYGQEMVLRQAMTTAEQTRINTELSVANKIQENALPDINTLAGRDDFDLAATMKVARETGGDFYDFAMLDDNHLALVVADVSDKGVPAAMFMMSAKARLETAASVDRKPSEVFRDVNNSLCINNKEDMFVTVWMGIVDLTTGEITSANAGHENPVLYKKGGEYVEIRERHGVFLGEFPGMKYTDSQMKIEKGDVLFLYTDGVTEASNSAKEMYGMEGLLACLNEKCRDENLTASEIMEIVNEDIAAFAKDAEQFDDITMMVLKI